MLLNINTTSISSNATEILNVEEKHQPYKENYWIVSETAIVIAILIDLYYLICLIPYALNLKKRSKLKKLVYLTLLSVVLALARFVSDQMVAFLGWQSDDYCLHSVSVSFLLYPLSVGVVYSVLWLRQNTFYSRPSLKLLVNKKKLECVRIVSIGSLLIIVASSTILAILWQIPSVTGWSYKATETGCRDANDAQDLEPLPLILSSVSLVGQLSLLGLLIYPLILSKKRQQRIASPIKSFANSFPFSLRERALFQNHHQRNSGNAGQQSNSAARLDSYKLSTIKVHEKSHNTSEVSVIMMQSDDESDIYAENIFGIDSDDYFSTSDLESEVGRPSPEPPQSLSVWQKYVTYLRNRGKSKSIFQTNVRNQRAANNDFRRESDSSAKGMIRKREKTASKPRNRKSKSQLRREKRSNWLIRKVLMLTTVCVISDIIITAIQLMWVQPELVYLAMYDVNLNVNITCIILSFNDWKEIFTDPWKLCCPNIVKNRLDSVTSQTSIYLTSPKTSGIVKSTQARNILHRRGHSDTTSIRTISTVRTLSTSLSRPNSPDQKRQASSTNSSPIINHRFA